MMLNSATNKSLGLRARLAQSVRQRTYRAGVPEIGITHLNLRRVFIIPTGAGFAFLIMLMVLFISSVNYSLSLGFVLTFLLVGIALIDIHMTYRNLAHLYLHAGRSNTVFAGETVQFELAIENRRKDTRYAIWVDFVCPEREFAEQAVDIDGNSSQTVSLTMLSQQRGWLAAPKVRLRTRFPLGLLLAWSYWQPPQQALIYPCPEENPPPLPQIGTQGDDIHQLGSAGHDDFAGIRNYQVGDTLKQLAWRQIARLSVEDGGQLISKQFEGGASSQLCLDFAQLPAQLDLETKISRLTSWVLQAEKEGLSYAFSLDNFHLSHGQGSQHQASCLRALALHGTKLNSTDRSPMSNTGDYA